MSQRQLRVGELVRHALADILMRGEVHDREVESMTIMVSEVRMTPDMKLATCFVMPVGNIDAKKAVDALERNRRFLRGAIGKRIDLRHTPDLRFRVDTGFETGSRIDELLRSEAVQRDLSGTDDDTNS